MLELRKEFEKEMSYIPSFINTHSELHHKVWLSMMDCNDILLILVVNRVLKVTSILKISQKFEEYILYTLNMDPVNSLTIAVYFTAMLDYLLERCIEEEEFESAENLKVFNELYFQNMTPYKYEQK